MYGKVFEDLFCSTLMDCGGDTAYVFIAMIVLSDEKGYLKHTANSLARLICKPAEIVAQAVQHLEAPDPQSNIKAYEGRRIVPLSNLMDDETRGWLVVNKEIYRDRASKEDKRESDRTRIAEKRSKNKDVAECRGVSQKVANVAHTDTDTDTELLFVKFWTAYPRKEAKQKALTAFQKLGLVNGDFEKVLAALESAKASEQWQRDEGKFIPHASTWLNGRRFEDEAHTPAAPRVDV